MRDLLRDGPSRAALMLRGVVACVVLGAVALAAIASGNGAFDRDPTVTAVIPASAGPVRAPAAVQYRGATVGTLTKVDAGTTGSRLTLRMDPARLPEIPGGVHARLLPRTLFGNQYVDLTGHGGGRLTAGAEIPADTSTATVQLYQAYTRLSDLLTDLRPAQLQVALTTLADALRGRGAELGRTIDHLHALAERTAPAVDSVIDSLPAMATVAGQLAASAPDALAALDDAVALSGTVVDEQQNLTAFLAAGTDLTSQAQRMLLDNADRVIRLTHASAPVVATLGAASGQIPKTLDSLDAFTEAGQRAFATGRFEIRAAVTFTDPYPYTAADCPRYPGLDGPNCGSGGTTGPVGSPAEQDTLRQLAPLLPANPTPQQPDLLSLLLGPLVRGTQVIVR